MASIIKQLNKQTGVTYVYESESYWDKEKRQPRSKRRLIGKIDAETGEIVPTGGGRKAGLTDMRETGRTAGELEALCRRQAEELLKGDAEISALKRQVMELTLSLDECRRRLSKIGELSKVWQESMGGKGNERPAVSQDHLIVIPPQGGTGGA